MQAAEEAVRRAGHAVVDMAYFSAHNDSPARYCEREMARVDVYVGIIGFRYGSAVLEQPEQSYTELEFETATALGLPRLIFFVEPAPEGDEIDLRQQRFRQRLRAAAVTVAKVTSPDELALRLFQSLVELRAADATWSQAGGPPLWVRPLAGGLLGGIIAVAVTTRAATASVSPRQIALAAIIGMAGFVGGLVVGAASDVALRWLGRTRSRRAMPVEDPLERLRYRAHVRNIVMRLASEQQRSLSTHMRIDLPLAERSGAVDDRLPVVVHPHSEPDRPLPRGTSISAAFDEMHGQMLILGAPGAGKTTTLLELARELLSHTRRSDSEPMPVVFDLASWTPRHATLDDWLVGELHRGYDVPPALGRGWVTGNLIIPLLDGLDEVSVEHRETCVSTLNRFRLGHGRLPLVVCSRVREYEELRTRLELRGALMVQPLSRQDVDRYLRQGGTALDGVRAALREDKQLAELLSAPLFLGMVAMAYRERLPAEPLALDAEERLRRRILADYVAGMLNRARTRRESPYDGSDIVRWLAWLASEMRTHGQTVLTLDRIHTDWLATRWQRLMVTVGVPVTIGVVAGVPVSVDNALASQLVQGPHTPPAIRVMVGAVTGLIALFVCVWWVRNPGDTPTGPLGWSLPALRRQWTGFLATGLILGVSYGLVFGLVTAPIFLVLAAQQSPRPAVGFADALVFGPVVGVSSGALLGLVVGVTFGLLSGLQPGLDPAPATPVSGVRAWRRNALVAGAVGGLVLGLVFWLVFGLGHGLTEPVIRTLADKLGYRAFYWWPHAAIEDVLVAIYVAGLVVGGRAGGAAYLRHLVLRQLLVHDGRGPRDYVAFLEYTTRLILLRRKGGGYEFVHRTLLEHFADFPSQLGSRRDRKPAVEGRVGQAP